ncbi:hypothetical protein HZS_366, partial [Henneguya salminicola]
LTKQKFYTRMVTQLSYKIVDHPREAKLDSKLLSRISEIGKKQTNYINPSVIKFSEKEFCQLLKNESVQNGGLKTIYEKISGIIRQTSKCSLLTSDFQLTLPTRKRPQTNFQSDSNLEAKIPKLMQNIENNDEISSKAVVDLYTSLARACQDETQPIENQFKAIPFYKFIINPNSFSQTIQNIFHLSFLVKNGNVVFQQVDDEYFITPNINRAESSQSLSNNQEIISFSMHIWREKIKKYNLLKTS